MAITLYGSLASPYVRRVRILLENIDHQFEVVNVYDDKSREAYTNITPIKKMPVLVDGEQTIFDSHIICQYLCEKKDIAALSIQQHNIISVIDAITDSLIILFMGQRSDLPVSTDQLIFKLQLERLPDSLAWLNKQAKQEEFTTWHFPTIALLTLIEWAEFRNLYQFDDYPELLAAIAPHRQRDIALITAPK